MQAGGEFQAGKGGSRCGLSCESSAHRGGLLGLGEATGQARTGPEGERVPSRILGSLLAFAFVHYGKFETRPSIKRLQVSLAPLTVNRTHCSRFTLPPNFGCIFSKCVQATGAVTATDVSG